MKLPVVHSYTHDSISMGEDAPTHQPVEQLASLRAVPGVVDLRPADANEIREAWRVLPPMTDRPVALVLGKQEAPVIDRARHAPASGLAQGGYILADPPGGPWMPSSSRAAARSLSRPRPMRTYRPMGSTYAW